MYLINRLRELTWREIRDELADLGDEIGGKLRGGVTVDPARACNWSRDNVVRFIDRKGVERACLPEVNGWLLLEAVLRQALGLPVETRVEQQLARFGEGGMCGWWPDELITGGRQYFSGRRPTRIDFDVDDAAWGLKYREQDPDDQILDRFLSPDSLPRQLQRALHGVDLDHRLVLRTWARPEWHKWECDLLCVANMISALPTLKTEKHRRIFAENQRLINAVIPGSYRKLIPYYEPKVFGVFLLLFYDHAHRPFLTDESRAHLREVLAAERAELETEALRSRWGGDDRIIYLHGYNLVWDNLTIPPLVRTYVDRHLLPRRTATPVLAVAPSPRV